MGIVRARSSLMTSRRTFAVGDASMSSYSLFVSSRSMKDWRLSGDSSIIASSAAQETDESAQKLHPGHRRNLSSDSNISQASTVLDGESCSAQPQYGVPLTAEQREWWEQRWSQSQADLATRCQAKREAEVFAEVKREADRSRAIRLRKMWRVCVYCDTLFTSNRFGEAGADATVRFAEEYPRACVAPGACDSCLDEAAPMDTDAGDDTNMGAATIRCSENFEDTDSDYTELSEVHSTSTDGLDTYSSADSSLQTETTTSDAAAKPRRKKKSAQRKNRAGFEVALSCSNRCAGFMTLASARY